MDCFLQLKEKKKLNYESSFFSFVKNVKGNDNYFHQLSWLSMQRLLYLALWLLLLKKVEFSIKMLVFKRLWIFLSCPFRTVLAAEIRSCHHRLTQALLIILRPFIGRRVNPCMADIFIFSSSQNTEPRANRPTGGAPDLLLLHSVDGWSTDICYK